jgi:hypothetical protein
MIGEVFLMFDDRWKPMYFFIGVLSKYNSKCNVHWKYCIWQCVCIYIYHLIFIYTLYNYILLKIYTKAFDNKFYNKV